MNKNIIWIIGLVLLVSITGGIFVANQQSKPVENAPQDQNAMMRDNAAITSTNSKKYVQYSKSELDQASGNRRVLFFYANWCPTCKPADADFTANMSNIPSDVTVIRVNYNDTNTDQEEKDLAKQYGITYQHTYVQIDEQGNEITKWNGGKIDELLANIK